MRSSVPLRRCSLNQSRTLGTMKIGHMPFQRIDRHARAGKTGREPRSRRRQNPALPDMATPTLVLPISPSSTTKRCLRGIITAAHGDAVEDQRFAGCAGASQHDRAAADLERPDAAASLRRFDLANQRDAVAAGQNLERHRQQAVVGVPIEFELGAIDAMRPSSSLASPNEPASATIRPVRVLRQPVRADLAAQCSPTAACRFADCRRRGARRAEDRWSRRGALRAESCESPGGSA